MCLILGPVEAVVVGVVVGDWCCDPEMLVAVIDCKELVDGG